MKKILTAMLLLLVVQSPVFAAETGSALFTDFSGQPQDIEAHTGNGQWLVVMIWANNCPVCDREAGSYAGFHEAHKDKDARVLGLSIDGQAGKEAAKGFIVRHKLPFPNLIGEPEMVSLKFQMLTQESFRGTPTVLLYGPDGKLRAAQAGAVSVKAIASFIAKNS